PSTCSFSSPSAAAHRDLHSFPTRRSSDLQLDRYRFRGYGRGNRLKAGLQLGGANLSRTALRLFGGGATRSRLVQKKGDPARKVRDRKSTRLNSSHVSISYAVFCLKKKNKK